MRKPETDCARKYFCRGAIYIRASIVIVQTSQSWFVRHEARFQPRGLSNKYQDRDSSPGCNTSSSNNRDILLTPHWLQSNTRLAYHSWVLSSSVGHAPLTAVVKANLPAKDPSNS